MLILVCAY